MRVVRWILLALGFLIGSALGQASRGAEPGSTPAAKAPRETAPFAAAPGGERGVGG